MIMTDDAETLPLSSLAAWGEKLNEKGFLAALAGKNNAATLTLAWLKAKELFAAAEDALKKRLWGDNIPVGQLRLNTHKKNDLEFIQAKIGESTRSVPVEEWFPLKEKFTPLFAENEEKRRKKQADQTPPTI